MSCLKTGSYTKTMTIWSFDPELDSVNWAWPRETWLQRRLKLIRQKRKALNANRIYYKSAI